MDTVTARLFSVNSRLPGSGAPTDAQIQSAANVQRIQRLVNASTFAYLFPLANMGKGPFEGNGPYTYANFLKAVAKWPHFCDDAGPSGSTDATVLDNMCRKELASVFAQWALEVGDNNPDSKIPMWRQALYYYDEMDCTVDDCSEYHGPTCDPASWVGEAWPCPPGKFYFGRGPSQLSYNYNYGPFSKAMFDGNVSVLLNQPELVTSDGWLAFAEAIWDYMTPQSPVPSGHEAAVGWWQPNAADLAAGRKPGFGVQIMILDDPECSNGYNANAAKRITYFQGFCNFFGIDPGTNLDCETMQQFDGTSSAVLPSYWERSWDGPYCELVDYSSRWSIYDSLDYNEPYCQCMDYYGYN